MWRGALFREEKLVDLDLFDRRCGCQYGFRFLARQDSFASDCSTSVHSRFYRLAHPRARKGGTVSLQ